MNSLLHDYYSYVLDNTETPVAMHRWSFLTTVGALLSKNVVFKHGHFEVYPNMYTMLVGTPGTRKTSGQIICTKLATLAGYHALARGKTSKEKFLEDLAAGFKHLKTMSDDPFDGLFDELGTAHECFIAADEFTNFVGMSNGEFLSTLSELWSYSGDYEYRVRNGKSIIVHDPSVSILAAATPTSLAQAIPPEMAGQGLMSRLILIHAAESGKKLAFPEPEDKGKEEALITALYEIRHKMRGEVLLTPAAKDYLANVYSNYPPMTDWRFRSYDNRRFTHLLKLCLITAVCNGRLVITEEDAIYSNTILAQAEIFMPRALSEFGNTRWSAASGKVIQVLQDNFLPMTNLEIFKKVSSDISDIIELGRILTALVDSDQIQMHGGKFSVKAAVNTKVEDYVNFSLLEEYMGIP